MHAKLFLLAMHAKLFLLDLHAKLFPLELHANSQSKRRVTKNCSYLHRTLKCSYLQCTLNCSYLHLAKQKKSHQKLFLLAQHAKNRQHTKWERKHKQHTLVSQTRLRTIQPKTRRRPNHLNRFSNTPLGHRPKAIAQNENKGGHTNVETSSMHYLPSCFYVNHATLVVVLLPLNP